MIDVEHDSAACAADLPNWFAAEGNATRRENLILENVIVTGAEIIGFVLSVGLLVYLTVALLKPELFG